MPPLASPELANSFTGRAKQLGIPHLTGRGEQARTVLSEAMVCGADALSLISCTEAAATLAWGVAMIDDDAAWSALSPPLIKKLLNLFDTKVNPAWTPDRALLVISGSLRARVLPAPLAPPPPLPSPVAAGGAAMAQL